MSRNRVQSTHPAGGSTRPGRRREIGPWLFHPVGPSWIDKEKSLYAQLAAALASQLLTLLKEDRVRPGDVVYNTSGVVLRIAGFQDTELRNMSPSSASNVIHLVAMRYGLLRHRPVHADDPVPPAHPGGRTRSWEISLAALVLAPAVSAEVDADLKR